MIKPNTLESLTAKDLAQMAKRKGISGWHSMRKQQLIDALQEEDKQKETNKSAKPSKPRVSISKKDTAASKRPPQRIARALKQAVDRKDISTPQNADGDRVVLMVRDAYWLHAYWEISSRSVIRARAAMAEQWHSAKPVLRVIKTETGMTSAAIESVERDITIHGAVTNWYIDVTDPPETFRVEIGYLSASGRFFSIARSNSVTTPERNSRDLARDQNWVDVAQQCDKILAQSGAYSDEGNDGQLQALFEERLKRPMGSPMMTRYGVGAEAILDRDQAFALEVCAELIVHGRTQVDAHVTVGGDPVTLRPDGSFTMRMSLPDGRQVMPVISSSGDGCQQQTVILAVERNTKTMEPVGRDENQ